MIGPGTIGIPALVALALLPGCDDAPTPTASAEYLRAKAAFDQNCGVCHWVEGPSRRVSGPSLRGIIGREAGTQPGYPYSTALSEAGFPWTDGAVDAFVQAPRALVPGTHMGYFGLEDAQARAAIVDYLEMADDEG